MAVKLITMNQLPRFLLGHKKYVFLASVVFLFSEVWGLLYLAGLEAKKPRNVVLVNSHNATSSALKGFATNSSASVTTPSAVPATPTAKPANFAAKPSSETKPPPPSSPPKLPAPPQNTRLGWPNNKFGVYSYRDNESIDLSAEMVNSNGGDWGWILFPMNTKDQGKEGWDNTFTYLKQKRLIPIIQLVLDPGFVPSKSDIDQVADFLNTLTWPTKKRFVSAFNEVNAAEYWGDKLDPEGHAEILNHYIDALKGRSSDFFVLNGAYNASARTGKIKTNLGVYTEYLNENEYLERMNNKIPGIFKKLDGWAVHTYPQPEYRGKPLDQTIAGEADWERGRNTMSSYKWELNILKTKFGVDLPIFITEMGWPHKEGAKERPEWYDKNTVADYYKIVFRDLYVPDNRVVAVIPFAIKVDHLDNFSFVGKDGSRYPQLDALKSLPKVKGAPPLP